MEKMFETKTLSSTNDGRGNLIEHIQTHIEKWSDADISICGHVAVNGKAQYDFERITEDGKIKERYCGYGQGCFWTDWQ
jgi:hypothetical protein